MDKVTTAIVAGKNVQVCHRKSVTKASVRRLYESIQNGLCDGLLSIAQARPIRFLTVEKGSGTNISYDEYQVFICPEPMSGRQQVYNVR